MGERVLQFPLLLVLLQGWATYGCTNILVSSGAAMDGSTQIAYNADSGSLYGSLGLYPAADHKPGAVRHIWDWDASIYLGSIPEVAHTYNVVGNTNEMGLIIGETTFGGLKALDGHGTDAIIDYGSLIWVTLQRAKTAREAIKVMDDLVQTYGYASDGESFSIADGDEVWLMELIGKGQEKGAVWVAMKVPEGMIGATANQARIRTFDQHDPANVLFAPDVVTFAQRKGLYPKDADPALFSFSDTYDPPVFGGVRLGEARVWNIFQLASGGKFSEYLDYAQGMNLTNRMPLFSPVAHKLSVNDTMEYMRTHFEGTWFDNTGIERPDVGAGPGHSPVRWRPLKWTSGGKMYINERTVGVQQTAWAFVSQSRKNVVEPLKGLVWFAPDESSTAVRIPVYASATRLPPSFADPYGQDPSAAVAEGAKADAYKMSLDSAFWVYNLVANMAYGERWADVYPLIQEKIHEHQDRLFSAAADIEKTATKLVLSGKHDAAVELLTSFGVKTGEQMTTDWRNFWMSLFARFRDGFTVSAPTLPVCDMSRPGTGPDPFKGCTARPVPDAAETGYAKDWYERIVKDDAAHHYAVPPSSSRLDDDDDTSSHEHWKMLRMNKKRA